MRRENNDRTPLAEQTQEQRFAHFWEKSEGLREAAVSGDKRKLYVWFQEFTDLVEGHLRGDVETLKSRAAAAETALATAQAESLALRKALATAGNALSRLHNATRAIERYDLSNDANETLAIITSPSMPAPSDTTALRALLLRVARACERQDSQSELFDAQSIVDAVLAKEGTT